VVQVQVQVEKTPTRSPTHWHALPNNTTTSSGTSNYYHHYNYDGPRTTKTTPHDGGGRRRGQGKEKAQETRLLGLFVSLIFLSLSSFYTDNLYA
jgi:hypothetical protein